MNCVISGNRGLAYVLDGSRALLIRAEDPEAQCEVLAEDFHRLFSDVTDRIYIEGIDIGEIRRRLSVASNVSTALSLTLLILNSDAPNDLRAEAATDLEELLAQHDVVVDLEAILSATSLPDSCDITGAEDACDESSATNVIALLHRLVARQDLIRVVWAGWNDIAPDLFKTEGHRRAARTVAVREGVFYAMVRHAEAGGDSASFLMDRLRMPTMLGAFADFRKLLQHWSGALPRAGALSKEADSANDRVTVEPEGREFADPTERGRAWDHARRPATSRNPGAKLLVDETIRAFVVELAAACKLGESAVTALVIKTRARLEAIHTRRADERPHFAKSISNVGDLLVRYKQFSAAAELLTWGIQNSLADAVTYGALIDALGKAGEVVQAQAVFEQAEAAGLTNAFTYNALLDTWGKAGDPLRAQAVFDAAETAGVANVVTYNSLLDAWGKAGDPTRAQAVFDAAKAAGLANQVTYNSLVDAWGKAGDPVRAQAVFDAARAADRVDTFTYNALLTAWGKAGQPARAQLVFESAQAAGMANNVSYNSLIDAWGKAGNLARAEEVFSAALGAHVADAHTYCSLVDAWGKAGDPAQAQAVFEAARTARLLSPFTYSTLVNVWGKAGDPVRAQEVFDAAEAAGELSAVTYNSLLDAWGKAGDPVRAQAVFDDARVAGLADAVTYNSLLNAWGKAGDPVRAQAVFEEARIAGEADAVTYNSLVDAWGKAGDPLRAQAAFDAAQTAGLADAITYASLIDAWGKAGDPIRAQAVFDAAQRAGRMSAVAYNSLLDAWGKAGDPLRAQAVFDAAANAGEINTFIYTSLVDAWGKAGEPLRAQAVFDAAQAVGFASEVTESVLLRALISNAVSEDVLTRACESLLSRRQFDGMSVTVARGVAWAAARLGRLDWIRSLPVQVRNARTLFAFALRVDLSDDALTLLRAVGEPARAALIAFQYRQLVAAGSMRELRSLATKCRELVREASELDSFSRVRVTETEARCLRKCGAVDEAIASWIPIVDLALGSRETRATLLAESGRDILIGGLRDQLESECIAGAQRLMQGWSLAALSDINDPETLWAASEALGGYADARTEMAIASPELVSRVRPILAAGAHDGRWTMEAVRKADLPDFYLAPALAGIEFVSQLKQELST